MKTKKLNLSNLKVESFVTSIENKKVNTIKGGTWSTGYCYTATLITASVVTLTYSLHTLNWGDCKQTVTLLNDRCPAETQNNSQVGQNTCI